MKFSIVTPCFNPVHLIKETLLSVVGQSAFRRSGVELEYIIKALTLADG